MTGILGTIRRRLASLVRRATVLVGVTGSLAGCGVLDVSDPTAVEEQELNDATGAALLRGAALRALAEATDDGAYFSGLLADEFLSDPPPFYAQLGLTLADELLDRRESVLFEGLSDGLSAGIPYGFWQELRHAAAAALPKLRTYAPPGAAEAHVGEMFALRGLGTLRLAEDFCPGFPLHDMVEFQLIAGPPHSTEAALERALADFDSALALATDSLRVRRFAQIGRARTLLALGRVADAGLAVADVPTDYVVHAEYSVSAGVRNVRLMQLFQSNGASVADQEGGTGLDFVTAADPRVQVTPRGMAADGVTSLYNIGKYPTAESPIVVASGIEARLIEAETALHEGGDWLGILNALRTEAVGGVAGLAPLADPGTDVARQDLLFRERAFWLFATGRRLADLRRLVQHYGRAPETVFPTGAYRLGGSYGAATTMPFPAAKESAFNPAVTGCTSR